MFAFLTGKGTPRHAGFALPRPLTAAEAVAAQSALMAVPGVIVARVDAAQARAWVGYRAGATHARALAAVFAGLGLPPRPLPDGESVPVPPHDACC
ncbi:MAG: hypothetical protein ABIP29_04340 [Candidatus Eisenbacteria bacterium]